MARSRLVDDRAVGFGEVDAGAVGAGHLAASAAAKEQGRKRDANSRDTIRMEAGPKPGLETSKPRLISR